jgi:hypothetical protein
MVDHYLWVSVAVGSAQVFDCLLFLARKGRISKTGWMFSVVEWIWGGVSIYVLMQENTDIPSWLPAVYIAYLILWLIYGVVTAARHQNLGEVTLTPREAIAGGVFGLSFALAALSLAV